MVITDNGSYVKRAVTGLPGLLTAQSAASAESKFLSLAASAESKFLSLCAILWIVMQRIDYESNI